MKWPCFYGIDMPTRGELIASSMEVDEIAAKLGVDSLGYLSLDGMLSCVGGEATSYCTACWTGDYRVPVAAAERDILRF